MTAKAIPTKPKNVKLDLELAQDLYAIAEREERTLIGVLRRALRAYMDQEGYS